MEGKSWTAGDIPKESYQVWWFMAKRRRVEREFFHSSFWWIILPFIKVRKTGGDRFGLKIIFKEVYLNWKNWGIIYLKNAPILSKHFDELWQSYTPIWSPLQTRCRMEVLSLWRTSHACGFCCSHPQTFSFSRSRWDLGPDIAHCSRVLPVRDSTWEIAERYHCSERLFSSFSPSPGNHGLISVTMISLPVFGWHTNGVTPCVFFYVWLFFHRIRWFWNPLMLL